MKQNLRAYISTVFFLAKGLKGFYKSVCVVRDRLSVRFYAQQPLQMLRQIDTAAGEDIIRAFEENRDNCQVAEKLKAKKKTAYKVSMLQRSGQWEALPRSGYRLHMTEEMISDLVSFVQDKPTITLNEMRGKLDECFPNEAVPSTITISRALEGEFVSLKLLRSPTTKWNSQQVKRERKDYRGKQKRSSKHLCWKLPSLSHSSKALQIFRSYTVFFS